MGNNKIKLAQYGMKLIIVLNEMKIHIISNRYILCFRHFVELHEVHICEVDNTFWSL